MPHEKMNKTSHGLDGTGESTPHTVQNVESVDGAFARKDVPHGDFNNPDFMRKIGPNAPPKGGSKK